MGLIGAGTRTAGRLSPWGRALAVAELAMLAHRHLRNLEPGEPGELRGLLVKSKGRRSNLTEKERSRFMELVRKLEPAAFAKGAAVKAVPLRKR